MVPALLSVGLACWSVRAGAARADARRGAAVGLLGAVALLHPSGSANPPLIASLIVAAIVPVVISAMRRTHHTARRRVLLTLGAAAMVSALSLVALVIAGLSARAPARSGVDRARSAIDATRAGNLEAATTRFADSQTAFADAHSTVSAPWLEPALFIPVLGANLQAIRTGISAGADLAGAAHDAAAAAPYDQIHLDAGRIDLAAIDALAKRFAVFAKAQERALEAGEAQRRTRGLLFASVSHDLKNPLNAILGFADLLDTEELTMAQRENLSFVISRGRELLTLIETILDAARVEAGQLTLQPKAMTANELVESSLTRARDLAGDAAKAGALVDIAAPDARVLGDTLHLTRAVAVIIALALRTAASDKSGRSVSITVKAEEPPGSLCITIAHGSSALSENEIEELFARRFTARHRGLTLGLGLARTVIELHGGTVTVESTDDGIPRVACRLPIYRETDLSAGSSPSTFDDG